MSKKSLILGFLALGVVFLAGCGQQASNDNDPAVPGDEAMIPPAETEEVAITEEEGAVGEDETVASEEEGEIDSEEGYMDISVAEAKEMIDSNADLIVVDVSPNYTEGHLPGAINYYVGDGSLDEAIPTLDQEAEYLVYCHTDEASILGAEKMVEAGFENVYRLEGNYSAWVEAGHPVETE